MEHVLQRRKSGYQPIDILSSISQNPSCFCSYGIGGTTGFSAHNSRASSVPKFEHLIWWNGQLFQIEKSRALVTLVMDGFGMHGQGMPCLKATTIRPLDEESD